MSSVTTGVNTQPGSSEDILRRAGQVPETIGFPTIDELNERFALLAAEHPQFITGRTVGQSTLGEDISCYTVGTGALSHLIVGGVHPNEPIGSWTAIHLAEQLITDPVLLESSGATWHIVPSIDPDGARLNEGWFASPQDRGYYARRFYRPAPDHQVEWSFPTDYKKVRFDRMLPETRVLRQLIDEVRPDLYVALHNGEMGGVYYYLSRPVQALYDILHRVPTSLGLPLDTGEPESPQLVQFAPAIFATGTIAETYDYVESLGLDPTQSIGGSSSSEYALRYNTLSLVAELPYWSHPDVDDSTELAESYADLVRRTSAGMRETGVVLSGILAEAEPLFTIQTPFLDSSRAFVPMLISHADTDLARADRPEAQRAATVAERFGLEDLVVCFRLRYGGTLLRALEAETNAGIAPANLRRLTERMAAIYGDWLAEAAASNTAEVIPISKLVGVQYGAILAAASHLAGG